MLKIRTANRPIETTSRNKQQSLAIDAYGNVYSTHDNDFSPKMSRRQIVETLRKTRY